jgi:hypothetical protein
MDEIGSFAGFIHAWTMMMDLASLHFFSLLEAFCRQGRLDWLCWFALRSGCVFSRTTTNGLARLLALDATLSWKIPLGSTTVGLSHFWGRKWTYQVESHRGLGTRKLRKYLRPWYHGLSRPN